jgi:phosphoadenosine phosphosulfate reductase
MPLDKGENVITGAPFRGLSPEARAEELNRLYAERCPHDVLEEALTSDFAGRIALVSSFGAESAVLLHMISEIDPATPVLFGDSGKLFAETLEYQQNLSEQLGLTNIQVLRPAEADLSAQDPAGDLHQLDSNACCHIRKVLPLKEALEGFDAWITGRKRSQSLVRQGLRVFETDEDGRIKINPLAYWNSDSVKTYMADHDLPPHPLVAQGFPSIGCAPCTTPVKPGEDPRAGRWRGSDKTECGIHFVNGKVVRGPMPAAFDAA